jgi:hypothetical protein
LSPAIDELPSRHTTIGPRPLLRARAQRVDEQFPIDEAAREVAAQDGMPEAEELRRQQPAQLGAEADRKHFRIGALEQSLAQGPRALAHAADQLRHAFELGVARQLMAELDLGAGR